MLFSYGSFRSIECDNFMITNGSSQSKMKKKEERINTMWSVSSGVVSSMAGIFEWIECTHVGCIDDATVVCVCAARWAGRLMAGPGVWWSTQPWIVVPPRLSRRCHIHNHRILFTIFCTKNQRNFLHTARVCVLSIWFFRSSFFFCLKFFYTVSVIITH